MGKDNTDKQDPAKAPPADGAQPPAEASNNIAPHELGEKLPEAKADEAEKVPA